MTGHRSRRHRSPQRALSLRRSSLLAGALVVLVGMTGFAATTVLTATATVPVSYAVMNTRAIGAADLKPSDCAALTLTSIVKGTGSISSVGNGGGELVLASAANDTISVKGGNECVIGGAGTDSVTVVSGTAVCVISTTSSQTGCTTVVRRP